jgi:hypothetical protein
MFFVLLKQFFPWDHPLPSDAKQRIHQQGLWSSLAPIFVKVCCSPSPAHLLPPQFLHERVFVSQEKRCTVSDLRAMLSMPWFLDSVPTSLEPSIYTLRDL